MNQKQITENSERMKYIAIGILLRLVVPYVWKIYQEKDTVKPNTSARTQTN